MRTILTGLLAVIFSATVNAQLQSGGSHAGFTVDADTKVGYSKFGPSTSLVYNNDDWFLPAAYGGTGVAVIDTTGASGYLASLQAKTNISFTRRMTKPMFTVVNNKLWLDAIYSRDYSLNYTSGVITGPDSSAFGNSAKNALNPNTNWQGTSTSFTNKTDLVDGFAHMRRDGTSVYDSLWMFFGVSTLGTNGDRYYDIELFKKQCTYSSTTGYFSTAGTAGGHTEWLFDASGKVTQTGDMIIAVTYSPGSAPVIDMRIWVSNTTYSSVTPYYFNFSSTFDGSGSYGYAKIVSKSGGTAWGSGMANYSNNATADTTYSTPWGTSTMVSGNNAWSQNYSQLQFVEIGLNLTRIGVDPSLYSAQGISPCESAFYSVLFKSRSSSSFTANLQDFLGPLDFYQASIPSYTKSSPTLNCNNASGQISLSNTNGLGNFTWSTSNGNISSSNSDSSQITITKAGTYYLSASPYDGCPTMRTDTFVIIKDTLQPVASAWFNNDQALTLLKLYGGSGPANQPVTAYGASQGITWDWSGPNGFTSTDQAPLTTFAMGTYQLILTEARNGCKDTATVWVNLSTLATQDITLNAVNNNGKATLQWQIHSSNETGEFIIEKSNNGSTYSPVAKLAKQSTANSFSYTDASLVSADTYYRIRFTGTDGKAVYSNIVKVNSNSAAGTITIAGNKSNSSIIVNGIKAGNGAVNVALFTLDGKPVAAKAVKNTNGNFAVELKYQNSTATFIYVVAVYIDNKIAVSKKLSL